MFSRPRRWKLARAYLLKSDATQHLISAVESLGPTRQSSDATASAHPEDQTRGRPSETEIRVTLEVILAAEVFRTSPQLAAFLRFIVEAELRGERASLKGYTIA